MDHVRVDVSRIIRLDIQKHGRRVPGGPPKRPATGLESTVINTSLSAASRISNSAMLLKEVADIANAARRIPVSLIGGTGPMFGPPPSTSLFTIGAGCTASIFSVVGVTAGAGIYGSNLPELGLYHSMGAGYWTNVGVSSGIQLTYVFGGPADFGGMSWAVGVDCDVPGVGIGISAAVIFGASGPPYPFLGWSVGVGAGVSVLPVDFTFQVSNTKLIPIR
jgi:hypothetical protein